MGRRLDALNAIAVDQGYTGDEPTSVVGAINAIVDAMGGDGGAVGIADAITALAPYIGGGGGATTDIWLWNNTQGSGNDVLPETIEYIGGLVDTDNEYRPVWGSLDFESVTEQYSGATIYGVHVKNVPVGAIIRPAFGSGYTDDSFVIFYSPQAFPPSNVTSLGGTSALKPIEGFVLSGTYTVSLSA